MISLNGKTRRPPLIIPKNLACSPAFSHIIWTSSEGTVKKSQTLARGPGIRIPLMRWTFRSPLIRRWFMCLGTILYSNFKLRSWLPYDLLTSTTHPPFISDNFTASIALLPNATYNFSVVPKMRSFWHHKLLPNFGPAQLPVAVPNHRVIGSTGGSYPCT